MGKSNAEYMREYKKRKREEKLQTGGPEPKKIARSSTERSRNRRDCVVNSCLVSAPSTSTSNIVSNIVEFSKAHADFKNKFLNNNFGAICSVCDRLWYESDVRNPPPCSTGILTAEFPQINLETALVCGTCYLSLSKTKIPNLSKSNGFTYPLKPAHLPELDLITERLISPRLPFMTIRRLRHGNGQYGILGQVINVPVSVNNMVNLLPRELDDDYAINVHIKRKQIHKSNYLMGFVKKSVVKSWLEYLVQQELYKYYDVNINESFFSAEELPVVQMDRSELSELVDMEENLIAQQQTLLWNEEMYLRIAPGENSLPKCILFDEHCEELSFPSIYLGQFRAFKEQIRVTPFMMATSELRRADRRGVSPTHLLYMAMKIMRIRTRDSLQVAFKFVGRDNTLTRAQIQSEDYIHGCIENNLAFLRHIPNSTYYWATRKRDLFAMIRQLGKPTFFLTMSANEIGWPKLIKLLYKLKNNGAEIDADAFHQLHYITKATLVNEDPVTCAIHFNKLVDTIIGILQSKCFSPFGVNYVSHFFKRIEFQHRGSPHAHILLWLKDSPRDALGSDMPAAINLINRLISVSQENASGHVKLQHHKHTFTCYKRMSNAAGQKCRFEAPFMPSRSTVILVPMATSDTRRNNLAKLYNQLWKALEENDYIDIDHFFKDHNINSNEFYLDVLRAGITRPKVFLKRNTTEKWINPFNPFILNCLGSNTDIQFIIEEYSCAAYVVEYVNKTNRGISNLQRKIITTMNEHPEFDFVEITRKLSIDMLNAVEITSQEAAWYLLRLPMSLSSVAVLYLPTVWPIERQRLKKTIDQMEKEEIDDDSTDVWKTNLFEKYEKRPVELEDLSLARAAANYTVVNTTWKRRQVGPRIIRYRNYDMAAEVDEYKREMVTLYLPFRNEELEILAEKKFLRLYEENEAIILQHRKEFESDLDIGKTIEICRQMCIANEELDLLSTRVAEADPFADFDLAANAEINSDIRLALLNRLGPIVKKRQNLMLKEDFNNLMRLANIRQKGLIMHVISTLLDKTNVEPLQIFFTGPAGCGKTFVIKLLMEIYNRFNETDGYCNAYLTCASTGKAAVAIDGLTVHTALKISIGKNLPLSNEVVQQYRTLFKYVRCIIIDEISMMSAELLHQVDARLKQITGDFVHNFGGKDIFLIGDLRQLPPVRATPIFQQIKASVVGPTLWRGFKFYELDQVMRQSNAQFSCVLTKIGNGEKLEPVEQNLVQTRFFTKARADELCPNGVRLFLRNRDVNAYNQYVLNAAPDKIVSISNDGFTGYHSTEQLSFVRQKLHKMELIDTGGLPYELILVIGQPYLITTNIDVADGLSNGTYGHLKFVERIENITENDNSNIGDVKRIWIKFSGNPRIGQNARKLAAKYMQNKNIPGELVPIARRTSSIYLNNNRTIVAKRNHFPLTPACAMTIHKSQGGTFDVIVYTYEKGHAQQLVYVALSRVTSIEGLFIVSPTDEHVFYHGLKNAVSTISLRNEFLRLTTNSLRTCQENIYDFINNKISFFTFNCQSLRAHCNDFSDEITQNCTLLMLSETWLDDNEQIDIPNFYCCVQFKRPQKRAAGVAIYKHRTSSQVVTPIMDVTYRQATGLGVELQDIGDICAAVCELPNSRTFLSVVVYISPNQPVPKIIDFIQFVLLPFTESGSALLKKDYHLRPMILSGDFNINFNMPTAEPLITFLKDTFQLEMNSKRDVSTTLSGTVIDAVFQRFLSDLESQIYISYFSFHKPIVSILP